MKKERQRAGLRAQREVGTGRGGEMAQGGGINGTKGDGNEEGAERNRRGSKWKMEQDGREQQGKMMCAVYVDPWQSGQH